MRIDYRQFKPPLPERNTKVFLEDKFVIYFQARKVASGELAPFFIGNKRFTVEKAREFVRKNKDWFKRAAKLYGSERKLGFLPSHEQIM
ncbi:MAG: hypothetical protein N3G22_01635 [Candidatus Micrarchaeota archaeon]|nr:hypothetical protein [Candidatus Micrarchaeota archaeon]